MIYDFLSPWLKRPALCAFLFVSLFIASATYPTYGIVFIPIGLFFAYHLPKWLLKICLICLVLAVISFSLEAFSNKDYHLKLTDNFPEKSYGSVESLIPRSSGIAVIVKTDFGRLRLTHKSENPPPMPGDSICFKAKYYPNNPPTVPGAFNTPKWLYSQNFIAYGKLENFQILSSSFSFEKTFYQFRIWIKNRLSPFCKSAETGLLLGLLAGDRSGIPDALQNDFRKTGLIHVLAISGFHVVLLSGLLLLFLKAIRIPHNMAKLLAVLLLLIYIPITGSSPAVIRAVFMFSIVQVGSVFQRKTDSLNSLGFALLLIVLYHPSEIWNPGFQLSASATAGIIAGLGVNPLKSFSQKMSKNKILAFIDENIIQNVYVTFCATLATAPFLAYHFQTFSPFSWFGNILVVPLVSFSMYAGLFTIISPFEIMQENFGAVAGSLLRLAALITNKLSNSPASQITLGPFSVPVLLFMSCLFATLPLINKIKVYRRIHCFLIGALAIYFFIQSLFLQIFPSWKLTFIDVGQGDSILLETPSRRHFLFDTGNGGKKNDAGNKIIPYLRYSGIRSLDAVIITHPDADHYGGLEQLLKDFPVKEIWISECARLEEKTSWQNTLALAWTLKIPIRDIAVGFFYHEKNLFLESLHPDPLRCGETNKESITFLVSGFKRNIILTGDLTSEGEQEIINRHLLYKTDILKLGHHGSKTSSSRIFLEETKPEYAIISSGKKNRYKHPSKEILDRLDSLKIPFLNTSQNGSIFIDVDKNGLKMSATNGFLKYFRNAK